MAPIRHDIVWFINVTYVTLAYKFVPHLKIPQPKRVVVNSVSLGVPRNKSTPLSSIFLFKFKFILHFLCGLAMLTSTTGEYDIVVDTHHRPIISPPTTPLCNTIHWFGPYNYHRA